MNSSIYTAKLFHKRTEPSKNTFTYSVYLMYLDLDELEELNNYYFLFSYNKWNVFSFFDKDHFKFLNNTTERSDVISSEKVKYENKNYLGKNTKERINQLLRENNLDFELGKVFVLTNLRVFGYIFNPVSFYFCFDSSNNFRAMFSEVNNTFGDQKMYLMRNDDVNKKTSFTTRQKKNYYISPFTDLNNFLEWNFDLPGESLKININSIKGESIELATNLIGKRKNISNLNLLYLVFRYPLYTLMIIFRIHYQALKLWLKKVTFNKKDEADQEIYEKIIENK